MREHRNQAVPPIFLSPLLIAIFLSTSCSAPSLTPVSGKTVYKNMSIEEVEVRVFRIVAGKLVFHAKGTSKYHRDFLFRLPEGEYVFTARTVIPTPEGKLPLMGKTGPIPVPGNGGRIDQIVIRLEPVRQNSGFSGGRHDSKASFMAFASSAAEKGFWRKFTPSLKSPFRLIVSSV